jgi:hypothetical protein
MDKTKKKGFCQNIEEREKKFNNNTMRREGRTRLKKVGNLPHHEKPREEFFYKDYITQIRTRALTLAKKLGEKK